MCDARAMRLEMGCIEDFSSKEKARASRRLDVCTNHACRVCTHRHSRDVVLDDNSALCMYIQAGNSPWSYCGCVANAKPSDVFALRWPVDDDGAPFATAAIGISVEPLAATLEKESVLVQHKETFAKRVAEDLFRFMQSFQTGGDAQHMVVPTNILDRWFDKFLNKFRRDPGFIDRPRLDAA